METEPKKTETAVFGQKLTKTEPEMKMVEPTQPYTNEWSINPFYQTLWARGLHNVTFCAGRLCGYQRCPVQYVSLEYIL